MRRLDATDDPRRVSVSFATTEQTTINERWEKGGQPGGENGVHNRECFVRNAWRKMIFWETMECRNLFCFWKIKENENPKRRFVEQETLIGVYAHVEVHTTHFILNMQSGYWQSFLRDSGSFSLVLNGGQKQMHHDRNTDHLVGLLHFAELPQFLDTLNWKTCCCITHGNVLNLWHHDSFLHIFLSSTICKKTPFLHPCSSITPTLHHFVLTTPSFDFRRLLSRSLVAQEENDRYKCQSDWPTDERRAPTPRAHIESQENHPSVCRHKASERW